jgi:hypothetical protein
MMGVNLICEYCGIDFVAKRKQKFCSVKCRKAADRKRRRIKDKEHLPQVKQCAKPKKSINEIVEEAKKHNMTYGQYVSLYGSY